MKWTKTLMVYGGISRIYLDISYVHISYGVGWYTYLARGRLART